MISLLRLPDNTGELSETASDEDEVPMEIDSQSTSSDDEDVDLSSEDEMSHSSMDTYSESTSLEFDDNKDEQNEVDDVTSGFPSAQLRPASYSPSFFEASRDQDLAIIRETPLNNRNTGFMN